MSTPVTISSWALGKYIYDDPTAAGLVYLPEFDGRFAVVGYNSEGAGTAMEVEAPVRSPATNTATAAGYYGGRALFGDASVAFAMAQSLETSNGMEISGLNAEEQSDISLTARWSHPQSGSSTDGLGNTAKMNMVFFVYYDALLVLYENNVVQLIE